MPFEIKNSDEHWIAMHSQGRCGGPRVLTVNGDTVLTALGCRFDGYGDDMLHSKSAHVYHKAGQAIFESDSHYPNGPECSQTYRYSGNSVRVTWDFNWPKGVIPKKPFEVGSCHLEGKWRRLYVVEESLKGQNGIGTWMPLSEGQTLELQEMPLSLVFERENGMRLEYSLGFDVWRWRYGLGMVNSVPLTVAVNESGIDIIRRLCDAGTETSFPEAREYRFMAILAWSWPGMPDVAAEAFEEAHGSLSVNKEGLDLARLNGNTVVRANFSELPCAESAYKLSLAGERMSIPCFEHKFAINAFKRVIRQLASFSSTGTLVLEGLIPGVCYDGAHCDKKGKRVHWDLQSIITLAAWAKNALGSGWQISCAQPEEWKELPSLSGIHLPNGFIYE